MSLKYFQELNGGKNNQVKLGYITSLREIVGTRKLINTGGRIVIENENEEILLIKRSDLQKWAFPAGGLEIGESISESIRREAFEETGLVIGEILLIGISSDPSVESVTYPNGDKVQNMSLVFFSSDFTGNLLMESTETLEAQFFSSEDLPDIIANEKRTLQYLKKYKETGIISID